MGKVLVVVDMQSEFIEKCASRHLTGNVVEKIKRRKAEGYEVFLTLDRSGGELDEGVKAVCAGGRIYKKHTYACKQLILDLDGLQPDTVEFCGVCTDICVIANALGTMAFLPFAEIVVDADCCASEGTGHLAALSVMQACNITVI